MDRERDRRQAQFGFGLAGLGIFTFHVNKALKSPIPPVEIANAPTYSKPIGPEMFVVREKHISSNTTIIPEADMQAIITFARNPPHGAAYWLPLLGLLCILLSPCFRNVTLVVRRANAWLRYRTPAQLKTASWLYYYIELGTRVLLPSGDKFVQISINFFLSILLALLWHLYQPDSSEPDEDVLMALRLKAKAEKKLKAREYQLAATRRLRFKAERQFAFTKAWATNEINIKGIENNKMNTLLIHSLAELLHLFWEKAPKQLLDDNEMSKALLRAQERLGYPKDCVEKMCRANAKILLDNDFDTDLDSHQLQAALRDALKFYRWYAAVEEEKATAKKEKEDETAKLKKVTGELEVERKITEKLRYRIIYLEKKEAEYRAKIKEQQHRITELEKEAGEQSKKLREKEDHITVLEKENKELLKKLKDDQAAWDEQKAALQAEAEATEKKIKELEARVNSQDVNLRKQSKLVKDAQTASGKADEALVAEIKQKEQKIQDLQYRLISKQQDVDERTRTTKDAQEASSNEKAALEAHLKEKDQKIEALQNNAISLKRDVDKQAKEIKIAQEASKKEKAALEAQLKQKDQEVKDLQARIISLEQTQTTQAETISKQAKMIAEQDEDIELKAAGLEAAYDEEEDHKKDIKARDQQIKDLTEKLEDLQEEYDKINFQDLFGDDADPEPLEDTDMPAGHGDSAEEQDGPSSEGEDLKASHAALGAVLQEDDGSGTMPQLPYYTSTPFASGDGAESQEQQFFDFGGAGEGDPAIDPALFELDGNGALLQPPNDSGTSFVPGDGAESHEPQIDPALLALGGDGAPGAHPSTPNDDTAAGVGSEKPGDDSEKRDLEAKLSASEDNLKKMKGESKLYRDAFEHLTKTNMSDAQTEAVNTLKASKKGILDISSFNIKMRAAAAAPGADLTAPNGSSAPGASSEKPGDGNTSGDSAKGQAPFKFDPTPNDEMRWAPGAPGANPTTTKDNNGTGEVPKKFGTDTNFGSGAPTFGSNPTKPFGGDVKPKPANSSAGGKRPGDGSAGKVSNPFSFDFKPFGQG